MRRARNGKPSSFLGLHCLIVASRRLGSNLSRTATGAMTGCLLLSRRQKEDADEQSAAAGMHSAPPPASQASFGLCIIDDWGE